MTCPDIKNRASGQVSGELFVRPFKCLPAHRGDERRQFAARFALNQLANDRAALSLIRKHLGESSPVLAKNRATERSRSLGAMCKRV